MDTGAVCSKFWPESKFSKKVFLHSIVEADRREKELKLYHVCEEKDILHSCDSHGHEKVCIEYLSDFKFSYSNFMKETN